MSGRAKRTWDAGPRLKVARRCPRCRANMYHFTHDRRPDSHRCGVTCSDCGHAWRAKLSLAERGLESAS